MNPTLATLLTISVTVIAAILVLVLIFFIPVLLQARRTAEEAEKLIKSVRVQVAPISRDVGSISRDTRSIIQSIHRQVDRVADGLEIAHDMAVWAEETPLEIKQRIEEPLLQLTAVMGGIKRRVGTMGRIICR